MRVHGVTVCWGAALAVVVALVVSAGPSFADAADLYVASPGDGGNDSHDCSLASPCATVARALAGADAQGTTIHVGPGTFSGAVDAGGKSVSLVGDSTDGTVLTNTLILDQVATWSVVTAGSGTLSMSDLTVQGGFAADVIVTGSGSVVADHVVLSDGGCDLVVEAGSASLTDSRVQGGGQRKCSVDQLGGLGQIQVFGGTVVLERTRVIDPAPAQQPSVLIGGGTLTADQSYLDDSVNPFATNNQSGFTLTAGQLTLTRSTVHGYGYDGVDNRGGTALISDDTFQDDVVGVNSGVGATTTVLRTTFEHELASLQGDISVGGSVLASMLGTPAIGVHECAPTPNVITDLGYNLSSDGSCGFNGTTSQQNVSVTHLGLAEGVADLGGPVPTTATLWSSGAVDYIPAGATYGPDNAALCPPAAGTDVTDLRGVPRPQGGACDAGSMELIATHTTLNVPTSARPHAPAALYAVVTGDATAPGTDPGQITRGTVSFVSGTTALCADVAVHDGAATCQTTGLGAGRRSVTAIFTPATTSALHASTSQPQAIAVASRPSFTSPRTARFVVGKAHSFHIHASGAPRPHLSRLKGSLPAGLHFTGGLGSATLKGTPRKSAVGRYTITLRAHNLEGVVDHVLRIVVTRH